MNNVHTYMSSESRLSPHPCIGTCIHFALSMSINPAKSIRVFTIYIYILSSYSGPYSIGKAVGTE